MRAAVTTLVVLLVVLTSSFGADLAQAMVDPQPSCDPEYIASGGTTQLYGPDWVWYPLMGGEWVLVEDWHWSDNGAGGSFWPSPDMQNPMWTGPGNHSGSGVWYELECTVTAFSYSEACTLDVFEFTDLHYVTASANRSSSPIDSGGTVHLYGNAECTQGHAITSWSWTDDVSGGTFDPSSHSQSPTWTAPINLTGSSLLVTFTLTATCEEGMSGQDTTTVSVRPFVHELEVTASCEPRAVIYGGTTQCSAEFDDLFGHEPAWWLWDDGGAGGTFLPSAEVQNPSYVAPAEDPGSHTEVTLTVNTECAGEPSLTDSDSADLMVGHGYVLTVLSTPIDRVYVAIDNSDIALQPGGRTPFTRVWEEGEQFTLEYRQPLTDEQGCTFSHWTLDGVARAEGDVFCPVTMAGPRTAVAHFYRFPDVPPDHWSYEYVQACYATGVVEGYPDGLYHPEAPVTRGQMAVFVARALAGGEENVPEPTTDPGFTDVDSEHWAYKYICYAVDQNVVQGYPEGDYRPDQDVTRDQMAVYMARAMVAPTTSVLDDYVPSDPRDFPDVPSDHWAYKYVEYCAEQGVVGGYPEGDYRPATIVTRDQMAVYIQRAFDLPM